MVVGDGSLMVFFWFCVALQDQLRQLMLVSCPGAAHFVVSAQQLVGELREEEASMLRSVLLHGCSLNAFTILASLTAKQVPPGKSGWHI